MNADDKGTTAILGTLIAGIIGIILAFGAVASMGVFDTVEPDCHEDEVYAWFGDYPDNVVWACVPLDNLR